MEAQCWICPKCFDDHKRDGPCTPDPIDGNVHTIPIDGRKHYETKNCWCSPVLNYKDDVTGVEQYTHQEAQ